MHGSNCFFLKDDTVFFVTTGNMWELLCNKLDTISTKYSKKYKHYHYKHNLKFKYNVSTYIQLNLKSYIS